MIMDSLLLLFNLLFLFLSQAGRERRIYRYPRAGMGWHLSLYSSTRAEAKVRNVEWFGLIRVKSNLL